MSWMRLAACVTACVASLGMSGAARAQLFFGDNFNSYADGALGAGGTWVRHSGTAGTLAVAGGNAIAVQKNASGEPTEDAHRDSGASQAPGSTWYYAAKFTVTDTRPTLGVGSIFPSYFLHFMEDITNFTGVEQMFRGRLYVQGANDPTKFTLGLSSGTVAGPLTTADADFDGTQNPLDNYRLDVDGNDFLTWQRNLGRVPPPAITNATGDANNDLAVDGADLAIWQAQFGTVPVINGQRVSLTDELSFGTEYTAVVSYTANDGAGGSAEDGYAKLWIGTDSASAALDTPLVDTLPNTNISNDNDAVTPRPMKWLSIRQAGSGNGPASVAINSVAIGDDFNAVLAGLTPTAVGVPEPASAGLLVCGLMALAARRRRR